MKITIELSKVSVELLKNEFLQVKAVNPRPISFEAFLQEAIDSTIVYSIVETASPEQKQIIKRFGPLPEEVLA